MDFTHWEDRYGRKLSEMEKFEIDTNLTTLLKIIIDVNKKELDKKSDQLKSLRKKLP